MIYHGFVSDMDIQIQNMMPNQSAFRRDRPNSRLSQEPVVPKSSQTTNLQVKHKRKAKIELTMEERAKQFEDNMRMSLKSDIERIAWEKVQPKEEVP